MFTTISLQVAVKAFDTRTITDPDRLRNVYNILFLMTCSSRVCVYQALSRELAIWSKVIHKNITPLYGFSSGFGQDLIPSLVSPYYHYGNITEYLKGRHSVNVMELVTLF